MLAELAALATDLARRAAEIQREGLRRGFEIREKSAVGDLVTEIDRAGERAIVEGILAARAGDAILGEEGTDRGGTSGVRWVIDPLDGTASYVRGYPGYAVSIGIEVDGRPAVGVVQDALGRVTVGVAGGGAERDGRPIRPSERSTPAESVLATGFGYDPEMRIREARTLAELHLAPWDTAAGAVVVEAAGAVFRQFEQPDGERLTVASPVGLLEPMLELLGDAGLKVS